jgi:hypothetical protein
MATFLLIYKEGGAGMTTIRTNDCDIYSIDVNNRAESTMVVPMTADGYNRAVDLHGL